MVIATHSKDTATAGQMALYIATTILLDWPLTVMRVCDTMHA